MAAFMKREKRACKKCSRQDLTSDIPAIRFSCQNRCASDVCSYFTSPAAGNRIQTMGYGKSITLFQADDGITTLNMANWNGECIKLPRDRVSKCTYPELTEPGVYFLLCLDTEDGQDAVYIGEAEDVKQRLLNHIHAFNGGKEPYYWQYAVVFTGDDLNKALVRYLEKKLTGMARDARRYRVLTKTTGEKISIKRHEEASMDAFTDNIVLMLGLLNIRILEPIKPARNIASDSSETGETAEPVILHLKTGSCSAEGFFTDDSKFVLKKGARISQEEAPSMPLGYHRKRQWAFDNGLISDSVTTDDIVLNSPSAASSFVLGSASNGRLYWKDSSGVTLQEILKRE